ncbi:transposase [Bradyrhizobium japonicum]|nr:MULTISPECIES: hypothetical protein [unclassified Bradyrhizobium]
MLLQTSFKELKEPKCESQDSVAAWATLLGGGLDCAARRVAGHPPAVKRRFVHSFFEKLPPCLVGIEACASSHYWSRELQALGHTVRLMPPGYVKPYVKRQKNDTADAEAICEAVTRPNMRFVPTKTIEQ